MPCDNSQLRRAPISITTSASFNTVERAAPAHSGCRSGKRPLAMLIGRNGTPLFSTSARIVVVGLGVGCALAENDQRTLRALENIQRTFDRRGRGNLRRRRIDHLDQRLGAGLGVHHLPEKLGGQIEIDAAWTSRHRGADGAREPDADIGGMQHAERRLAERLGDRKLVHLLVVALLQVDDLALRRAGDQDHREAVGGGMGECGEAVEKARCRYRQANAGLLGQESCDRRRIAGVLFVTERDHPNAGRLRHAAEVGDRDAGHAIDCREAVELQRIDDEVKAIGELLLRVGRCSFRCSVLLRTFRFSLIVFDEDEFVP